MNRFLVFAALVLATGLHFSCTSDIESAEQVLARAESSGSSLQGGLVSCRSAGGCAEIPADACSAFGGTVIPSCPVGSSSSSFLPGGSVFCRSATGCAEMSAEVCSVFGGEVVVSCPNNTQPSSSSVVSGSSSGGVSSSVLSSSSSVIVVISSSSAGGGVVVGSGGPVSRYGKLQASGNKLVGSKTGSTAVQVRGVSLFWSNTGWGGDRFFNATAVNAMVDDWKAEIIRVPIGYSENGGYATDASNLTRVKAAINAAIAKDVYVIIDWHSHNAHNELSAATKFFTEMAQTYGSNDHVIFEIYNEPLDISWATIKTYASSIISTIRQHSNNLILVGTPNWDQDVNVAASSPISDANVAYVFHFYAYTHPLSSFQSKIKTVLDANLPVFVSEYGTTHADGGNPDDGNYNTHSASNTNAWHTFMDNNKISSCAWSVNDKYEGSAFFGTTKNGTFSQTAANFSNTSMMTASGKYIYEKLNSYATGSTPSSSSGGGGTGLFCDYGPENTYGGGCFPIEDDYPCDEEWGWVVSSCPGLYCDWGPVTIYGGGCFPIESSSVCKASDGGEPVTFCSKNKDL